MNRREFVETLVRNTGLAQEQIDQVLSTAFELIAQQMVDGNSVQLHGFGTFGIRHIPGKRARDTSGQVIWVPARRVPHFRAGQPLNARFES